MFSVATKRHLRTFNTLEEARTWAAKNNGTLVDRCENCGGSGVTGCGTTSDDNICKICKGSGLEDVV